jgi:hypothetical protein
MEEKDSKLLIILQPIRNRHFIIKPNLTVAVRKSSSSWNKENFSQTHKNDGRIRYRFCPIRVFIE